MFRALFTVVGLFLASALGSQAATLHVVDGQLTGATGVNVGGTLYDVVFLDGTCIGLFDGCDDPGDFAFTTQAGSLAASLALMAEVFIDDPVLGAFDSAPGLTMGCSDSVVCNIFTPYDRPDLLARTTFARNDANEPNDGVTISTLNPNFDSFDSSSNPFSTIYTFALWTESAAVVPLPAGLPLLLAGLAGLAGLRMRKRGGHA